MTKYIWIGFVLLAVAVKATSTSIQFAAGFVIPWIAIGAVLSPLVWIALRKRFNWRWYHWLNTTSILMAGLVFLVNPLLQHFTSTQLTKSEVPVQALVKPAAVPYKDVQLSWGVVLGAVGAIIVWYEECSSHDPNIRPKLEVAFVEWKGRNNYMDTLRSNVYRRAIREGGEIEAARLSAEARVASEREHSKFRAQLKSGADMNCDSLLQRLRAGTYDPVSRYKGHVDILHRAADQ